MNRQKLIDNKVRLTVNGREISLNPFVTGVFANVIAGLVDSLDKIPDPVNRVEILIDSEGGGDPKHRSPSGAS